MATERKVSMKIQVLLVLFVPIANIWTFYRIHRLRRMVVYVVVPTVILIAVMGVLIYTSGMVIVCLWTMDGIGYDWVSFVSGAWFEQEYGGRDHIELSRMIFNECDQSRGPNLGALEYATELSIAGVIIHVWAVCLIYRWSRKWNEGLGNCSSNAESYRE